MSVDFSGRASAKEEDQQEKGEGRFYPFSDSAVLISLGMQETLEVGEEEVVGLGGRR